MAVFGLRGDWAYLAYCDTLKIICGSQAQTLDGMMAKARAAKAETRMPDGREEPTASVAGDWAWEIMNDLLAGSAVA